MKNLVLIIGNEALTDTFKIAQGVTVEHRAVIQLVRRYRDELGEFGRVQFEMRPFDTPGGTQTREVALLNEYQATTLLTFMKNVRRVRRFKIELVKAFFRAMQLLRDYDQTLADRAGSKPAPARSAPAPDGTVAISKDEYIELLKTKINLLEAKKQGAFRRPLKSEEREQILAMRRQGVSNPEIARRLGRPAGTIRHFVRRVAGKMGCTAHLTGEA